MKDVRFKQDYKIVVEFDIHGGSFIRVYKKDLPIVMDEEERSFVQRELEALANNLNKSTNHEQNITSDAG